MSVKSTTEETLEELGYVGSGNYYLKSVSPLVIIVKTDPSSPCVVYDAYVRTNEVVHVKDVIDVGELDRKFLKAELLNSLIKSVRGTKEVIDI